MALAKICGITTLEGGAAAAAGDARMVGFVFFPKSPRAVTPAQAAALAAPLKGQLETVAVVVDPDDALLAHVQAAFAPDWIQLHGHESPARAVQARRYAGRGVIKALPIARSEDFAPAAAFADACDMLLFDAKAPAGADLPGGNGAAFDWRLLAGRRFARPWILSGGLGPANVGEAIALSGAQAVDVSSGVERAPGLKDPALIAAFLAAAHAALLV